MKVQKCQVVITLLALDWLTSAMLIQKSIKRISRGFSIFWVKELEIYPLPFMNYFAHMGFDMVKKKTLKKIDTNLTTPNIPQ